MLSMSTNYATHNTGKAAVAGSTPAALHKRHGTHDTAAETNDIETYVKMASQNSRYLIDKEKLIALVRDRPAIWDKNAPVYKIKSARTEAWREICSLLNEDYENNLSHSEKVEYYMTVVKSWTTTRDGWARSMKRGRNPRPYYHHDKLLFLSSVIRPQSKVDTAYEQVEYLYPDSDDETKSELTQKSDDSELECKPEIKYCDKKSRKLNRSRISKNIQSDSNEDEITELKWKRCRVKEEYNPAKSEEVLIPFPSFEDRHLCFFKSIQPSLATLDEEQVLEFQSGVISLLQSIRSRCE